MQMATKLGSIEVDNVIVLALTMMCQNEEGYGNVLKTLIDP
jgi:hypothetical protein